MHYFLATLLFSGRVFANKSRLTAQQRPARQLSTLIQNFGGDGLSQYLLWYKTQVDTSLYRRNHTIYS